MGIFQQDVQLKFKYLTQNVMIKQLTDQNKLRINDLMYNIQQKLGLMSQINQNSIQAKKITDQHLKELQTHKQVEQTQSEINLPMQQLHKKMLSIINEKSPSKIPQTLQKKRMQLVQLQTGTRNIDEIKYHRQKSGGIFKKQIIQELNQVAQFQDVNSEGEMNQSIMGCSKSSSKILSRFNSIQVNYTQKIKALSFKVSLLQQRLDQNQQEKHQLLTSLQTYKALFNRKQQQIDKEIENKLQQIKDKLIQKFAQQCRLKYNEYISELKELNTLLNEERKKRKFFEEQNKILKLEKENYEQMYKGILKKQKQWLMIDINQTKNQLHSQLDSEKLKSQQNLSYQQFFQNHIQQKNLTKILSDNNPVDYSQIQNKPCNYSQIFDKENKITNNRANNFVKTDHTNLIENSKNSKSKSKSKSRSKNKSIDKNRKNNQISAIKNQKQNPAKQQKKRVSTTNQSLKNSSFKTKNISKSDHHSMKPQEQMTKQELIPFLAKGIQELKQKLKIK